MINLVSGYCDKLFAEKLSSMGRGYIIYSYINASYIINRTQLKFKSH